MKGIIIYTSRYGSTRQYAEWLQAETGFDLCDVKKCPRDLSGYDVAVLGSNIFAGRVTLAPWIRKQWASLQGETVLLFVTHMTPEQRVLEEAIPQSLQDDMARQITVFPVGGRYILERMSFLHRTMIKMVASADKNPETRQEMLTDRDDVSKEDLRALLDYLRTVTPNV